MTKRAEIICPEEACGGRVVVIGGDVTASQVGALGRCSACGRAFWIVFSDDFTTPTAITPARRPA